MNRINFNEIQPTLAKRPDTDISNWRQSPHSSWAFQNVRALIPTQTICAAAQGWDIADASQDLGAVSLSVTGTAQNLETFLSENQADSMVVFSHGKFAWQWQAEHTDISLPHIVFSVSKSITAMLTGILVDQKLIDVTQFVSHYLPGTKGSAYEHCTVQHLLDMTVALDFTEDYLHPDESFVAYRNATGWNPIDQTKDDPRLETFLYGLNKAGFAHGEKFNYKSPNSDLLGILLEKVSGIPFANLLSALLWQPMGAATDAYVTVDPALSARAAGGICVTTHDLARFGQLLLQKGSIGNQNVVPEHWIVDSFNNGDRQAWLQGNFVDLLPAGQYRNKWYQVGNPDKCLCAIGIHGQWLYLNPRSQTVIALLSSQTDPLNDQRDLRTLAVLELLSREFL